MSSVEELGRHPTHERAGVAVATELRRGVHGPDADAVRRPRAEARPARRAVPSCSQNRRPPSGSASRRRSSSSEASLGASSGKRLPHERVEPSDREVVVVRPDTARIVARDPAGGIGARRPVDPVRHG